MMVKKLFDEGCFDYKNYIHKNMKKLALSIEEASVLTVIIDNSPNNISSDEIMAVLPLTKARIEKTLSSLLDRHYYNIYVDYSNGVGQEKIDLSLFFNKVEELLNNVVKNPNDDLYLINDYVTRVLNRVLTPKELEIVSSLVVEDRYTLSDFENAVDLINKKGRNPSIRTLAQALASKDEVKPQSKKIQSSVIKDFYNSIK